MEKVAIISVYDKRDLEPFAKGLSELGYGILSTGGTAKFLTAAGVSITSISEYTGHPEILDGRVKSLHPKIHGGILARRDNDKDMAQLAENDIRPVDFVIVNLYPFTQQAAEIVKQANPDHDSLVEYIDIGGPTMIRAAAKNSEFVVPVCDPGDYPGILDELRTHGEVTQSTRQKLAEKVFAMMSGYDGAIGRYFSLGEKLLDAEGRAQPLADVETLTLRREATLRYGENPHQSAGLYRNAPEGLNSAQRNWKQLQGKELSYNNLLDMYGTIDLFLELVEDRGDDHVAVVIKHSNPCGAALRSTPLEAFEAARACDPLSAFGGIVALSGVLDKALAESITEGFVEIVLVEEATEEAQEILAKKKNLRLLTCDFNAYLAQRKAGGLAIRNYFDEFLVQTVDGDINLPVAENVAAGPAPSPEMLADMQFAWRVCKHVKSNTIVIAKDKTAVGIGAGQMSRFDAAKLAVQRAAFHGHSIEGAVGASDAFLPFPDTLEVLSEAGVTGLVQPGGSIKDKDVIESANASGVTMVMTGERHFRH